MRRKWGTLVAGTLVAATAIAISIVSISAAKPGVTVIHVVEHATTDTVIDLEAEGDSTGDLLTFHNEVYDETDSDLVGTDQGDCIRIDTDAGTWECRWVTVLEGGSITVEGPFSDSGPTVLAITGGTGQYRDARGQMRLLYNEPDGSKFDFIFRLLP
jgi:hypothetical protein